MDRREIAVSRLAAFPGSCVCELTPAERDEICQLIGTLPPWVDPLPASPDLLTELEITAGKLPSRLSRVLIDFRKRSNEYGTLLIRGMPLDPLLPHTPPDGNPSREKATFYSEYGLLMILSRVGTSIAYVDEKEGLVVTNICPVLGHEARQENTGSLTLLEFHTEDGFHPAKPDFIGLTCLRADHDHVALTLTSSVRRALPMLSSRSIDILRQPLFRIRLASSFAKDRELALCSPSMAVLTGDLLSPHMCVDFHAMEAITSAAVEALSALKNALAASIVGHPLMQGDTLVIDNRVAAHARSPFQPRYDGHDRWLQRSFAVSDFRESRHLRPGDHYVCECLAIELSA